jgi:hypothetical protein
MTENDDALLQAQERMAALAVNLSRLFDPMRAACLLAASACTILRANLGDEAAAAFFSGIADEIEAGPRQMQ